MTTLQISQEPMEAMDEEGDAELPEEEDRNEEDLIYSDQTIAGIPRLES